MGLDLSLHLHQFCINGVNVTTQRCGVRLLKVNILLELIIFFEVAFFKKVNSVHKVVCKSWKWSGSLLYLVKTFHNLACLFWSFISAMVTAWNGNTFLSPYSLSLLLYTSLLSHNVVSTLVYTLMWVESTYYLQCSRRGNRGMYIMSVTPYTGTSLLLVIWVVHQTSMVRSVNDHVPLLRYDKQ